MIDSLYRTLGITLHTVRANYVCGDFIYSTKYWIEQFAVLPRPTRSMYAGTHAEPLLQSTTIMHILRTS